MTRFPPQQGKTQAASVFRQLFWVRNRPPAARGQQATLVSPPICHPNDRIPPKACVRWRVVYDTLPKSPDLLNFGMLSPA